MTTQTETLSGTRVMTRIGLCVALCAVSSYISFPLPFTPAMVTALTIMVNLVGFVLNPREAFITMLVFVLLGAVGVPVFVGGTSGFGKLLGPTGGFILGFLLAAPLISFFRHGQNNFKRNVFLGIAVGMIVIYIAGAISMYLVAHYSLWQTLVAAVFPFIFGDIVKVLIAATLAKKLVATGFFRS